MRDDKLPDWRSAWGHAMADAVADTLAKYDLEAMRQVDPALIASSVLMDLGFAKVHRLPKEARQALAQWCRGVVETEDRR